MAEIKNVNPSEMRDIAGQIESKIEEWRQQVTNIYGKQQELDAMWDGDANDEFNRQWEENRPKYDKLAETMALYAQTVKDAAQKYEETEDTIKGNISKF
ncbi:MAG: WXG100 family type VII secretion target [Ruminiclostridium sp.]|nr:WXG100 family type VII secretion target [Ruminiclostridium sp.]